jgi:CRP/FNR family cyclic AMP-dependent transcriptional regulator
MAGPSLEQLAVFEAIAPDDLAMLAAQSTTKTFPKQSIICSEGDPSNALYVILGGSVKFFLMGEDGRQFVLGTAGLGDYFGEMTLDGGPRSAAVMTLEVCRCAIVPRADMENFVAQHPKVALLIMRNFSRRVRTLTEKVKSLALCDVYGRIANLLLESRQADGAIGFSQQDIADRVGASRQMVSRIMNDLIAGGYIERQGRRLLILKPLPRAW